MSILSNNVRQAGSHFVEHEDYEHLVDYAVGSIEDPPPQFVSVPTVGIILIEIILLLVLEILMFVLPTHCEKCLPEVESSSLLIYSHSIMWSLLLIFGRYLQYQHNCYRKNGYLEFYRRTKGLRQLPFYVFSGGNALLLVVIVLLKDYCSQDKHCPKTSYMMPINYIQIISVIEFLICLPALVLHLVKTLKFNHQKPVPDVHQEEYMAGYMQSQALYNDIGFRDEDHLDDVLEKQADLIRYLKQHNASLGRKLVKVMAEVNALKNI